MIAGIATVTIHTIIRVRLTRNHHQNLMTSHMPMNGMLHHVTAALPMLRPEVEA